MADSPIFEVKFRRRRKQKTNYEKRLALLKSAKPRLVVRTTNKRVISQVVEYNKAGDKVIVSTDSNELKDFGWNHGKGSIPSAYLTGFLCGLMAKKKGVTHAVLDIGKKTPVRGSVPFAVLKGAVDSGVNVPHAADAFPSEDRIKGKHISAFAQKLDQEKLAKIFSGQLKNKADPKNISQDFEKTKQAIESKLNAA
ncbi:MAG: 50S ribosomal protein L18 [Candidatus Diapherotrites archaeon]|nr:50S ribosomal protein L18 [Candidatus Diapherotrites archaeon]